MLKPAHSTTHLESAGRAQGRRRFRSFILVAMVSNAGKSENEPENLGELLESRASGSPDKTFLFSETDGRRFTYAEFNRSVDATARMLASHTIKNGDVVSLLMPNSAECIIAYFACWKLGALAGPVNSLLKEHEIEFVMNNSEAKVVLVHSEFRERVENIRAELPHLKSMITFDNEADATKDLRTHDCRLPRPAARRMPARPAMLPRLL